MQLKLKVLDGSQEGTEIPVPGPKFIIGRDKDCHLRPKSDVISRHHCVLIVEQGYVGVRDFNSKNGTFVNDTPVVGEHELKAGDELLVGPLRFSVLLDTTVGGAKRPKIKDVKEAAARTMQLANDGEMNISEWLDEEEESTTETSVSDSARDGGAKDSVAGNLREIEDQEDGSHIGVGAEPSTGDTTEIDLKAAETLTNPKKNKKKEPGKLPKAARIDAEKSENTQSAAINTLRKMRDQKKQS